jgi:acyl-CoA thioesterase-1
MSRTRPDRLSRRAVLAAATAALATAAAAAARPAVVTVLGDSITAGYGLPAAEAFPARLQAALIRSGVAASVRGAGVSGDTTAAALARVDFSVQADTSLCIVALGGNDLLQGLDPRATRANLTAIVRRLKARHIRILLAGVAAPSAIGRSYAGDFNAVFGDVARSEKVPLYPDLLAGVGRNDGLKQADGLHPNAAGAAAIAGHMAPLVARLLRRGE